MNTDDPVGVSCEDCGWARIVPNGPSPLPFHEADAFHRSQEGAEFHVTWSPVVGIDRDTPVLSDEERAIGAAYLLGGARAHRQAWEGIIKTFNEARRREQVLPAPDSAPAETKAAAK